MTFTKPSSGLAVSIIDACPVVENGDVVRVVTPAKRSAPASRNQQAISIRITTEGLIDLPCSGAAPRHRPGLLRHYEGIHEPWNDGTSSSRQSQVVLRSFDEQF